MSATGRRMLIAFAVVWLLLGVGSLVALRGFEVPAGELALVLPAILLAVVSSMFVDNPREGLLWASVHGPPFLNIAGVVVVYFIPATLVLFQVLPTAPWEVADESAMTGGNARAYKPDGRNVEIRIDRISVPGSIGALLAIALMLGALVLELEVLRLPAAVGILGGLLVGCAVIIWRKLQRP